MITQLTDLHENIVARVRILNDGCWLWIGSKRGRKYGQLYDPRTKKIYYAHRFFYLTFTGPLEEGLEIDHTCTRKLCVNPAHLELVTHAVNMARATSTHCINGHEYTEENTALTRAGHKQCRACKLEAGRRFERRNPTRRHSIKRRLASPSHTPVQPTTIGV